MSTNKNNENFKELRIEPIQSEKVKEHISKKKSKSPKKHHHKNKENFTKNKTSFLDEQPESEEKSPKNDQSGSPQKISENTKSLLSKPAEKSMMKSKSKEFKGFAEDNLEGKNETGEKKQGMKGAVEKESKADAPHDLKKENGEEAKKEENKKNKNDDNDNKKMEDNNKKKDDKKKDEKKKDDKDKKKGDKKKDEGKANEKQNEKEIKKENEAKRKEEAKKKELDKKLEKEAKKKEEADRKKKEKEDKQKEKDNSKNNNKIDKNKRNEKEENKEPKEQEEKKVEAPNFENDEKPAEVPLLPKSQQNPEEQPKIINPPDVMEESSQKKEKGKKKELDKEKSNKNNKTNSKKEKAPFEKKQTMKPPENPEKHAKKKTSTQLVLKRKKVPINKGEFVTIETQNLQRSQKNFGYMKLILSIWMLPVLILNEFESQKYYDEAIFCPDITKYAKLKMYTFLAMIMLVALVILDLVFYCWMKGKKSYILTQFIFTANYIFSIGIILGYMTFLIWKQWNSKVQYFSQIYIEMLVIFVILSIVSIRFIKLQILTAISVICYALFFLIYFNYYYSFNKNDVYTLIKLGEILSFMVIASVLTHDDPFEGFKPIFDEEMNQNSSNLKPLSSILIKDKKTLEDPNMVMIEMEKNPNLQKKNTLDIIENNTFKLSEPPKKSQFNQSYHSMTDIDGDNKKWLKIFNNLPKGVLILDRSFQIIYSNRKINKYLGIAEGEKTGFVQSGFESLLPMEKTSISGIEFPQILENFIQTVEADILLKKMVKKIIEVIDLKDFFSDLKYVINEALNSRNSQLYQVFKQQTVSIKYLLNQKVFELMFYSMDLKSEEKDYLVLFFMEEKASNSNNDNPGGNLMNRTKISEIQNNILLTIGGELRHPINIVVEMLERMKDNIMKMPNLLQHLDPAYQSSYLIFNYVNGLLDLSNINLGTFKMILMEYDLKILIDHLINILKPQAVKKGIELASTIVKKLPRLIFTDPLRLMQVLYTLLRSSIKSTEKGSVKILISDISFEGEVFFQFEIKDTSAIVYSQKSLDFLSSQDKEFMNLDISIAKKLIKELGVSERNTLLISGQKNVGNQFKFYISNKRTGSTFDYIENLEDGLLESNYIEKKNKNIENFKETTSSEKDLKSSYSGQQNSSQKDALSNFSLFKAAMNNHYCFCAKILLVFSDYLHLVSMQNILLNLGYLSDFCGDFYQGVLKLNERINFPQCGKYCAKYELILVDGDSEHAKISKIKQEKVAVVAFYDNKDTGKKPGVDEILGKNFCQEEIAGVLERYLGKKAFHF